MSCIELLQFRQTTAARSKQARKTAPESDSPDASAAPSKKGRAKKKPKLAQAVAEGATDGSLREAAPPARDTNSTEARPQPQSQPSTSTVALGALALGGSLAGASSPCRVSLLRVGTVWLVRPSVVLRGRSYVFVSVSDSGVLTCGMEQNRTEGRNGRAETTVVVVCVLRRVRAG